MHDRIINVLVVFKYVYRQAKQMWLLHTASLYWVCVYFWCPRTINCSISLKHINGEMDTASYFCLHNDKEWITCVYEHNRLHSLGGHSNVACFKVPSKLSPWKIEDKRKVVFTKVDNVA